MAYEETDKLTIPITKLQWGLRGAQIFFALLAMFTISAVIGWDNKYFSASLFSVFFLFIVLVSIFFAAAIVGIPYFYNTKGKFKNAARALSVPRIEFVLSAIWAVLIFIFTSLLSIDAYALRKCDPSDKKYAEFNITGSSNQSFYNGLPSICRTQRAANAFGWFALTAWLLSLVLIAKDWQKTRRPAKPQEPITYNTKPSTSSLPSSSFEEQSTPAQHQEQMQDIYSSPPQHPQHPQQFQPTFPQQQTFSSPPLQPIPGPMPPSGPPGISIPEPQIQGQGQGQVPGQNPGISFPEPKHY